MQSSNPVLLVEDDPVNAMAVEKAFRDVGIAQPLVHVRNGEEALECLRDRDHKKPDFILLDLNMPKMNGIEFLRIVKADPVLRSVPVVMLTTSQDQRDIAECFALNAAGYMTVADICQASAEQLSRIEGIGAKKAEKIIEAAKAHFDQSSEERKS